MSGLEPFFLIAGTAATALSQIAQTNAQSAIAQANAAAQERRANEERAVSQHKAAQRRRQADLMRSTQQARFASSGGGLGGSAATIMAETAGEGEYQSGLELWSGESRARGLEDEAAVTRAAARFSRRMLPLKLAGTIMTGASAASRAMGAGADPYGGWETIWRREADGASGRIGSSRWTFG